MSEHNGNSDRVILSQEGMRSMGTPAFRAVIETLLEMDMSEVLRPALDNAEPNNIVQVETISIDDFVRHWGQGGRMCWRRVVRLAINNPDFPLRDNPDQPGTLRGDINAVQEWFDNHKAKSSTELLLNMIAQSRRNPAPKELGD